MSVNKDTHESFVLTTPNILSLFKSDFPNPDGPEPSGPWGPVMRRAAQSVYRDAQTYGLGWHFPSQWYAWAAAYAQALAEEVIDRASLMQQVAAALPQNGGEQGIIIIGGMLEDFVDGCGTGKILQLFPPPRPHPDPNPRLTPFQLVLIAAQFQNAANANTNHGVRQEFTKASEQLLKTGMGRLQSTATAVGAG